MTDLQDEGTRALRSEDPQERVEGLRRIAAAALASPAEIEAMTACLGAPEKLVQRRAAETFAELYRAGIDVEPALLSALSSQEIRQRWGGAFALSLIKPVPEQARAVLLECLGMDDGDIRWAAADLIFRGLATDADAEDLYRLLLSGNVNQRKMAAYCMRAQGKRVAAAQSALTSALADPSVAVRLAALAALSRVALDAGEAARRVAVLLDDADPGVRRAAAAALGEFDECPPGVLDGLHRAQASDDQSLQRAATRSLAKLRQGDSPRGR